MFARKVAARLKPNALPEFIGLMDGEILPWLRTQEGFLDLITLAAPDGIEVATISFWDHEGSAQVYSSEGYPEALNILVRLLDGTPYVKTFEVVSSTFDGPNEAETLSQESRGGKRIQPTSGLISPEAAVLRPTVST